jgi:hypothetical protein
MKTMCLVDNKSRIFGGRGTDVVLTGLNSFRVHRFRPPERYGSVCRLADPYAGRHSWNDDPTDGNVRQIHHDRGVGSISMPRQANRENCDLFDAFTRLIMSSKHNAEANVHLEEVS